MQQYIMKSGKQDMSMTTDKQMIQAEPWAQMNPA